jgi:hypothetical protein
MEELSMKKLALLSMLAVLASGALLVHVQASNRNERPKVTPRQDKDEAPTCSSESLEGVYGFSIRGTRPAPAPPSGIPNYVPGTIEQVIGVGTLTFDGDGNFAQITNDKGSLSGILVPNHVGQGTYTINPDCSGTITVNPPPGFPALVSDMVIVNHGKEFHGIVASPQAVMVSIDGRKVN